MTLREVLNIIDDETWVVIDLPAADGAARIVMWAADWIGADEEAAAKVAPYLDRNVYDNVYAEVNLDPERDDHTTVPMIVIPVEPDDKRPGNGNQIGGLT